MNHTWWKESVVYQVYWRSFYDSDGDGYGDLEGILEKMDYIENLGTNVIWLNPIYESPDKDNGYDISNYFEIMSKAGSIPIWERLLQEIHRRSMKLIMDLVVNHTSDQHAWFLESSSSVDNPKRDWYIWKDAKNGSVPNNWRSYFSPSAWEWNEATGQYFFHSFAPEQPDLNWENPELRQEIYRMMRFWLDKGIDGFRLDAIALLAKQEGFPDVDNPLDIRYLTNNPGLHGYLQEMNECVLRHYDILTVGEAAFVTPEKGLKYVAEERQELNTLFHFEVCDEMPEWDMLRFKNIQKRWYEGLWGKGWNSQFLNNHDHARQVSRYGNEGPYRVESAKLLATLNHTLPGIPYVYQGEEIGMTGVRFNSIEQYQDIAMKNRYAEEVGKGRKPDEVFASLQTLSRDNSRTPMQWDDTENSGFTSGTPWINMNPNYKDINVEKDLADPNSIYCYYQKLINLRKKNKVMVYGSYEELPESVGSKHFYAYVRSLGEIHWVVLLNHADHETEAVLTSLNSDKDKQLILANYADVTGEESFTTLVLRPHEIRIYQL